MIEAVGGIVQGVGNIAGAYGNIKSSKTNLTAVKTQAAADVAISKNQLEAARVSAQGGTSAPSIFSNPLALGGIAVSAILLIVLFMRR